MEKSVNAVLIILLALVAILIIFLFIELEKLDISFEDDFDIPINFTIPENKPEPEQPKINNTKPVLIKPNEISNLEQTNNGTIRWSNTVPIPTDTTFGSVAHCSPGEIAVDGGTDVISGYLEVRDGQLTGPKNSTMHIQEYTSWKTTVENQGNSSGVYKVFVICN